MTPPVLMLRATASGAKCDPAPALAPAPAVAPYGPFAAPFTSGFDAALATFCPSSSGLELKHPIANHVGGRGCPPPPL